MKTPYVDNRYFSNLKLRKEINQIIRKNKVDEHGRECYDAITLSLRCYTRTAPALDLNNCTRFEDLNSRWHYYSHFPLLSRYSSNTLKHSDTLHRIRPTNQHTPTMVYWGLGTQRVRIGLNCQLGSLTVALVTQTIMLMTTPFPSFQYTTSIFLWKRKKYITNRLLRYLALFSLLPQWRARVRVCVHFQNRHRYW